MSGFGKMPTRRTPEGKAALTGARANHPERFKDRFKADTSKPIGAPPAFLSAKEKKSWKDFAKEWSWITGEDRGALIVLCQMRSFAEDPASEKNAAFYTAYRLMLSEFGGTPTSRSKVYHVKDEAEDDPFAKFGGAIN